MGFVRGLRGMLRHPVVRVAVRIFVWFNLILMLTPVLLIVIYPLLMQIWGPFLGRSLQHRVLFAEEGIIHRPVSLDRAWIDGEWRYVAVIPPGTKLRFRESRTFLSADITPEVTVWEAADNTLVETDPSEYRFWVEPPDVFILKSASRRTLVVHKVDAVYDDQDYGVHFEELVFMLRKGLRDDW